jgi:hypothetical protein
MTYPPPTSPGPDPTRPPHSVPEPAGTGYPPVPESPYQGETVPPPSAPGPGFPTPATPPSSGPGRPASILLAAVMMFGLAPIWLAFGGFAALSHFHSDVGFMTIMGVFYVLVNLTLAGLSVLAGGLIIAGKPFGRALGASVAGAAVLGALASAVTGGFVMFHLGGQFTYLISMMLDLGAMLLGTVAIVVLSGVQTARWFHSRAT